MNTSQETSPTSVESSRPFPFTKVLGALAACVSLLGTFLIAVDGDYSLGQLAASFGVLSVSLFIVGIAYFLAVMATFTVFKESVFAPMILIIAGIPAVLYVPYSWVITTVLGLFGVYL